MYIVRLYIDEASYTMYRFSYRPDAMAFIREALNASNVHHVYLRKE